MKPIKSILGSLHLLSTCILCISIISCSDELEEIDDINLNIDLGHSFQEWNWPATGEISVGNYHEGGVIFYIDSTGEHGLIASLEDLSLDVPWWNGDFIQTDANSESDGLSNTFLILEAQGDEFFYAAKLCADYEIDGIDDWYLPSKDELNLLFENKDVFENIPTQLYWTSTEYEIGSVWVQDFASGEQHLNNSSDSAGTQTRAIRAF